MVRASIARHVQGAYEVREAADGEEGWNALLGEPRVKVVISDLSMPKLDGYQLLERIRGSRVTRIREIPVMMISGSEEESERKRASELGATDFITKGIGTAEVLARIDALSQLARAKEELDATRVALAEQATTDPVTQTFTIGYMVKQGSAMFSYARRHKIPIAVMRLGLDDFEASRSRIGDAVADQILAAVAKLVSSRMRREDCVARTGPAEFSIMSPSATAAAADVFAQRLVAEIDAAKISWQGQSLKIRASIGACDSVAETVESFADLLVIAQRRMLEAREAGGGRVVAIGAESALATPAPAVPSIEEALAMLAEGHGDRLRVYVADLARRIYPLVRFCDEVFENDMNTSAEIRVHRVIEKARKLENEE
jgi:diguanylate cyclase (GGDEF)-like protein